MASRDAAPEAPTRTDHRVSLLASDRASGLALALALGLAGVVALAGCSFVHSSGSFSDSSASASRSSGGASRSSSASSRSDHAALLDDVESYTESFVKAGGSQQSFLEGVGDLSRKRGVTDWEADPTIWKAIGRGLGRTNANPGSLAAYERAWSGGDRARMGEMERGVAEVR
jgi:hypothetical protein